MNQALLLGLGVGLACAGTGIDSVAATHAWYALARVDGYWQVHQLLPDEDSAIPCTRRPGDKRVLVASNPGAFLYLRQGRQGVARWQPGSQSPPQLLLDAGAPINDFTVSTGHGFLVSVFAANAKENTQIWWFSSDRSEKALVVGDLNLNEMPAWMPNGDGFLFVKTHKGQSGIYRAARDGSGIQPWLVSPRVAYLFPAPSPDGTHVVFCRRDAAGSDLWITDREQKDIRLLYAGPGRDMEPSWVPDGSRVVFSTWDGNCFRSASIRSDGSGFRYLSPAGIEFRYPVAFSMHPAVAGEPRQ